MTKHHETRTYCGKPACAGSMVEGTFDAEGLRHCSVCGRTGISSTWGEAGKINTHLHPLDLAGRSKSAAPVTPAPAPKPVIPVTPRMYLAIQAFYQNPGPDTYKEMKDSFRGQDFNYVTWATKQGWDQMKAERETEIEGAK